ncbi:MAG TPA: hypothetical protein VFT36_06875 [Methylomirabilota bacterium]|nr:hypothetical protein [Methylomirabilota bacterium]
MKRRIVRNAMMLGLLIGLVLAGASSGAWAQERTEGRVRSTRSVSASEVIDGDYFAAGSVVTMSGTVNGDVYAFGGQVVIDGRVNGDVIVAAGRVSISGRVSQDVRVAGGQVTLSGEVGRNVTVAGGSVELARGAAIKGGLVAAGGTVHVAAPIEKVARVAAGSLIVSSRIGGNLDAAVGALTLASNADVQGDVRYMSRREASVDRGAQIRGRLSRTAPPGPTPRRLVAFLAGGALLLLAVSFVSTLVLGLLSIRFLPRYHESAVAILREKPWTALGVGFLAAVVTPVVCLLLLVTIVGAPLGLILALAYAVVIYWGRIFVASRLGEVVCRLFRAAPGPGWTFLVGLVVYYLLVLIPLVGRLVVGLVVLFGLGAELIGRKQLYLAARRQDLL